MSPRTIESVEAENDRLRAKLVELSAAHLESERQHRTLISELRAQLAELQEHLSVYRSGNERLAQENHRLRRLLGGLPLSGEGGVSHDRPAHSHAPEGNIGASPDSKEKP